MGELKERIARENSLYSCNHLNESDIVRVSLNCGPSLTDWPLYFFFSSFQNLDNPSTAFISTFALTQVLIQSLNYSGADFARNLSRQGTYPLAELFRSRNFQTPAGNVYFDQRRVRRSATSVSQYNPITRNLTVRLCGHNVYIITFNIINVYGQPGYMIFELTYSFYILHRPSGLV